LISARLSCPAALVVLGLACHGCTQRTHGNSPARASVPTEKTLERQTETPQPGPPVVELTPPALVRVKEIVASAGITQTWALRLEASWSPKVCSPQHSMRFEVDAPKPGVHAFESGGIRVAVLERQVEMLRGTMIDFGEKNGEQGFIIKTPNFEGKNLEKWGPILAADPLSSTQ
jgi:Fe-S cluster assembly iron-binding protein IscA